jgi:hypothetical protein
MYALPEIGKYLLSYFPFSFTIFFSLSKCLLGRSSLFRALLLRAPPAGKQFE